MKKIRLSIIVPTYNCASDLAVCLSALTQQRGWNIGTEYEVIVVDDASTDQTEAVVARFPVTSLKLTTNQGRAMSRWRGAQAAQGQQLLFVDARVILAPNFLQTLKKLLPHSAILMGGGLTLERENKALELLFNRIRRLWYGSQYWPQPAHSYFVTATNFNRSPKGFGVFSLPKKLFLALQKHFTLHDKQQNDDTAWLAHLVFAQKKNIWRSRQLAWQYHTRQTLRSTLIWLFHRGQTFADYYLQLQTLWFWLILLGILTSLFFFISLPALSAFLLVGAGSLLFLSSMLLAQKIRDLPVLLWQLPLAFSFFASGILVRWWHVHRAKLTRLLAVLFLVYIAFFLWQQKNLLGILKTLSLTEVLVLVTLYGVFYMINGLFLRQILRLYNVSLSYREGISIAVLTSFANAFMPFRGGAGWRAWYLKKQHGFALQSFLQVLAGSFFLTFNITMFLATLVSLWVMLKQTPEIWPLMLTFFGLWLGSCVFFLPLPPWLHQILKSWSKISALVQGWQKLSASPRILSWLLWYGFLNTGITVALIWMEYRSLDIRSANLEVITWWQAFLLATSGSVALVMSITPAGLGIKEGLLTLTGQLLTFAPEVTLLAALLDRAINLLVLLVIAPIAWYFLRVAQRSRIK